MCQGKQLIIQYKKLISVLVHDYLLSCDIFSHCCIFDMVNIMISMVSNTIVYNVNSRTHIPHIFVSQSACFQK